MGEFIFTIDTVVSSSPVVNTGNSFTDLSWNSSYNGTVYVVTVTWSAFNRILNNDGLTFQNYYVNNTKNITKFGNIPLTNMGYQFTRFKGVFSASDRPVIPPVMFQAFCNASSFNSDISAWDVSGVTNMSQMFMDATSFNGNISSWNVGSVSNMADMFRNASSFNCDISAWNVANVTLMNGMFSGASSFNGNISSWNVSAVTNMNSMFLGALNFNCDISAWNVANVTLMNGMFFNATRFNSNVSSWNVIKVTNMSSMFRNTTNFTGDISSWNVGAVTNMANMFYDATNFNSNIGNWDISGVTNMTSMFRNASSFNNDISLWDTNTVTNMSNMFNDATNFNSSIGNWNYSRITTVDTMITNCGFTPLTYSNFLQDLSTNNSIPSGVSFGINGFYRYDDVATNGAYAHLTGTKAITIIDNGAYPESELGLIDNILIPEINLDPSTNNTTYNIPRAQQYTIISDSGGRYAKYDNNENYNLTVTFVDGVSLNVYTSATGDLLKIYNQDASGTLLYSSDISRQIIDISANTQLFFNFTSNSSTIGTGFVAVVEIIHIVESNICFVASTPVNTDQGIIPVDKLTNKNSIRGKPIKFITETISKHEHLVLIKKDTLFTNVPSQDTIISMEHKVFYKGTMMSAKNLPNIILIPNTGEILYNVLLETHECMLVNSMIVETLHPDNLISKIYNDRDKYSNEIKSKMMHEFVYQLKKHKVYKSY